MAESGTSCILSDMAPSGKPKSAGDKKTSSGTSRSTPRRAASDAAFPGALAALLRSRRIRVPAGLADAPPQAYASQPASFVDNLVQLPDADLRAYAEKIASYAKRQAKRALQAWEASPLVAELRRRGLKEPAVPARVVGASVSLAKPLKDWSDAEIRRAAEEWSRLGQA